MSGLHRLILLHPDDSVMVCTSEIAAGDLLLIDGTEMPAPQPIAVGHKVARTLLRPGDKVIKYGAAIGSMTSATPAGSWVHSHNMKSDYLASHTRDSVRHEGK